jgi:hypothetical protein
VLPAQVNIIIYIRKGGSNSSIKKAAIPDSRATGSSSKKNYLKKAASARRVGIIKKKEAPPNAEESFKFCKLCLSFYILNPHQGGKKQCPLCSCCYIITHVLHSNAAA